MRTKNHILKLSQPGFVSAVFTAQPLSNWK